MKAASRYIILEHRQSRFPDGAFQNVTSSKVSKCKPPETFGWYVYICWFLMPPSLKPQSRSLIPLHWLMRKPARCIESVSAEKLSNCSVYQNVLKLLHRRVPFLTAAARVMSCCGGMRRRNGFQSNADDHRSDQITEAKSRAQLAAAKYWQRLRRRWQCKLCIPPRSRLPQAASRRAECGV